MSEEQNTTESLEYYLSDSSNISIYQDLEEISSIEPLAFFKLYYELRHLSDDDKVITVIEKLNGLNLTDELKFFTLYHLLQRYHSGALGPRVETPPTALFLLEQEYALLERLINAEQFDAIMFANSDSPDERAKAAVARNKMVNGVLDNMLRKAQEKAEHEQVIEIRARQSERERLEREFLPQIQDAIASAASKSKRNPEFTTNRQVLALCYILKQLQVKNVDKTVQTGFIEFLTGKNNKEIYDRVRNFDTIIYNKSGEDAAYVKNWFEKLGLTEIAKEIDTLIGKESKKL